MQGLVPSTTTESVLPTRARGESGATLIEMAIILPLLVMLVLGIVTAGIAFGQANALQTAAREGARFGATLTDDASWLSDVASVTKSAATGALDDGVPGRQICVALIANGTTKSMTEGVVGSSPCFSDDRPADEDRVQVYVEREATIDAALFSTDITIDSSSVMRYER